MKTLEEKIKDTKLFSDGEKIELLARVGSFNAEDRNYLEGVIARFDEQMEQAAAKLADKIQSAVLDLSTEATPQERKAVDEAGALLQSGVDTLVSPSQ